MVEIAYLVGIIWLCVSNAAIAKRKNRNAAAWVGITIVGGYLAGTILASIYVMIIYKGAYTDEAVRAFLFSLQKDPVRSALLVALSFGGALIMRFILEKQKPLPPKTID